MRTIGYGRISAVNGEGRPMRVQRERATEGPDQNAAVSCPRTSRDLGNVADGECCPASDINSLQLTPRKEADGSAVGRPKGLPGVLGARQDSGLCFIKRS